MGDKEDGDWISIPVSKMQARIALTVVVAALLGGIGYPVVSSVLPARHDPFTGKQGAKLERRIENLENKYHDLRFDLKTHSHQQRQHNHRQEDVR